jgi:MbtH protein
MTNRFESLDARFSVLSNNSGQYSLWPQNEEPPTGWRIAYGPAERSACLHYINENWTDLRPRSRSEAEGAGFGTR